MYGVTTPYLWRGDLCIPRHLHCSWWWHTCTVSCKSVSKLGSCACSKIHEFFIYLYISRGGHKKKNTCTYKFQRVECNGDDKWQYREVSDHTEVSDNTERGEWAVDTCIKFNQVWSWIYLGVGRLDSNCHGSHSLHRPYSRLVEAAAPEQGLASHPCPEALN